MKFLKLLRPINGIIASVSAMIPAFITHTKLTTIYLWAALAVFFITSFGNVLNDIFDIEIDRINKPQRPLAKGEIKITYAGYTLVILLLLGLIFAAKCGKPIFLIAVFATLLLIAYSLYLKRIFIVNNFVISLLGGLPFIVGGILANNIKSSLVPFGLAFLYHFGREILKDLEDKLGDAVYKVMTFATKLGVKIGSKIALYVFIGLVIFSILPYIFWGYNIYYLLITLIGVDLPIILITIRITRTRVGIDRLNQLIKLPIIPALFALAIGSY